MAAHEKIQSADPPNARPGVSERDPRVQMSAERTLLAWVRTSLALMAFGFVLARFALILSTLGIKIDQQYANLATGIGVVMVALGAVASSGAPWHYRRYFARIRSSGSRPFAAWTLAMIVAYTTAVIAVALIVFLLLIDAADTQSSRINLEPQPAVGRVFSATSETAETTPSAQTRATQSATTI